MPCPSQDALDAIFPPERADAFFDALYGGAEEGAYNIRLICQGSDENSVNLAFELSRRPGKCLKCSLTYGLPAVFQRHPIININKTVQEAASAAGIEGKISWRLGSTQEMSDDKHLVPLIITAFR